MPSGALNNAIVTTVASVRMFLLAEKDTIEIFCVERPEYCHQDAVPSVSWLSPEDKDFSYILVFWDFYVFLIKNQGPESTICGMKRMDKQLVWGCVLRNRTIAVLHLDFELCLESIQSMFTNLVTGAGFETKFQLTKSEYTCGKPKDSDSGEGAPQKWSESIRCFQNSIFFLKKDGISSIYLLSLREMAFAYAEQGHWLPSLKLCVEVCNKKIRADSIETTEIRVEATRLATAYVDRFVDRSKRNEELQGKILRVSMDALIGTENEDFLFESLRMKFDEIVFWQVIQGFVEAGMISKVPVKALKDGAMFLQKEELEWVLQNLVRADLEENEDEAHVLMQIVKKRKLWPSLYRLGLIWPQENLGIVLGTMMAELMFSQEEVNLIFEKLTAAPQEERKGILVDPKLGEYIRVFWFLKSIVNWQMVGIEEYRKDMEVVWLKVVGWMMDPSNIKVLSSTNINAYLEVYFDLFLNVEFSSSKRIALDLKSRLESLKSQIGILEPEKEMEAPKSPFSPSKKRSRKRKDSTGPAIKEEEEDEEEQAEHLLLFKAIIQNLFQFANPDQSVNIAFLALKLMTLSVFNRIYRDSSFLKTIIVTLLSWPFLENQLWFNYEYVKKEDFEEKIVRVMSQFSKTKEFQTCRGSLQTMAVENGFRRVNGYLIETISGAVGALKYYMSNSMAMSHQYLFNWIKKMVVETQNEKDKREFCTNVMKSLGDLVGFSNPDEDQQEEDERNCTHFALCRPGTSQVPRVALYYS